MQSNVYQDDGISHWAKTERTDVELKDGKSTSHFIKVISSNSQPNFAPKPISHGTYDTIPDTRFSSYFLYLESEVSLGLNLTAKGPDPELNALLPVLLETVIWRLLRPLESEGQSVKHNFVYGDMSGESLISDACCFHVHNESCNRFGPGHLDAHHDYVWIITGA
ncbi:hypothetical protein F4803DRAFT_559128 [Xylaria telfairii]|nr:hypothetical protein F4803DRAFT_559128 [Xylaria telfairii]